MEHFIPQHPYTKISVSDLLAAYSNGYFPMASSAKSRSFFWVVPHHRGILPLDNFAVSKNVQRLIRNQPFEIRYDTAFEQVMDGCADRPSTWINPLIRQSYLDFHKAGFVHSVEVYLHNQLVGGLYGVAIGGAFFGETMFKRMPEADKVALFFCHKRLIEKGFLLWDTQFYTPHLGTFGCIEISQTEYLKLLDKALLVKTSF